jgi:hypothetical protein
MLCTLQTLPSRRPDLLAAFDKNKTLQIFRSAGFLDSGGKGEIRTHGTPKGTLDFESSAFDHSATFPSTGD